MTLIDTIKGTWVKARHGDKSHRVIRRNKAEVVLACNSVVDGKNRRISDIDLAKSYVPGTDDKSCVGCR